MFAPAGILVIALMRAPTLAAVRAWHNINADRQTALDDYITALTREAERVSTSPPRRGSRSWTTC